MEEEDTGIGTIVQKLNKKNKQKAREGTKRSEQIFFQLDYIQENADVRIERDANKNFCAIKHKNLEEFHEKHFLW